MGQKLCGISFLPLLSLELWEGVRRAGHFLDMIRTGRVTSPRMDDESWDPSILLFLFKMSGL